MRPDRDLSDDNLEPVAGGKGGSPVDRPGTPGGAGVVSDNAADIIGGNGASLIGKTG